MVIVCGHCHVGLAVLNLIKISGKKHHTKILNYHIPVVLKILMKIDASMKIQNKQGSHLVKFLNAKSLNSQQVVKLDKKLPYPMKLMYIHEHSYATITIHLDP
jgi:uncharacterized protein YacL